MCCVWAWLFELCASPIDEENRPRIQSFHSICVKDCVWLVGLRFFICMFFFPFCISFLCQRYLLVQTSSFLFHRCMNNVVGLIFAHHFSKFYSILHIFVGLLLLKRQIWRNWRMTFHCFPGNLFSDSYFPSCRVSA